MSVATTGSKTVNNAVAPHLTGATLTALFATPVENLTVAQVQTINDALERVSAGDRTKTLGQLFS
jgi:hypothetical protein